MRGGGRGEEEGKEVRRRKKGGGGRGDGMELEEEEGREVRSWRNRGSHCGTMLNKPQEVNKNMFTDCKTPHTLTDHRGIVAMETRSPNIPPPCMPAGIQSLLRPCALHMVQPHRPQPPTEQRCPRARVNAWGKHGSTVRSETDCSTALSWPRAQANSLVLA